MLTLLLLSQGLKRYVDLKDVIFDGKSDNAKGSALERRFALAGHEEVRKVNAFNNHPNIMVIRDVCWARMWFTVELVAPLIWTFWEKLPWCSRLDMAGQFLSLLQMLHDKDLVHCDLKPDQFGVAANGEIKLIDLDSISRYRTAGALLANKSCSMSTPAMQCCGRSCMRHRYSMSHAMAPSAQLATEGMACAAVLAAPSARGRLSRELIVCLLSDPMLWLCCGCAVAVL